MQNLDGVRAPLEKCRLALITSQAFSLINFRGSLIRMMVSRGVKVFALAPDYDDASRSAVLSLGAVPIDSSMARSGMNPLRDVADIVRLAMQLRRLRLDLTLSYFIKPVIYGTIAARLAAVPKRFAMIEGAGYAFTDDARSSLRRRLLRLFVTVLYKFGLHHASHVFMLNPDDKKLFVGGNMVSAEKVQLLDGIGLDLNYFHVVPPVQQPVSFILIARLLREKGVYDFVEAARKIRSLHPETRFLLLGSVDLNPGSVALHEISEWVAEGVIEWPGQVQDVRPWLAQSSVFVLPSYREGLPRSTQEAMAMGRPVITTDVPGCRETVIDGVNGYMVQVRSPEELARAMLTFVRCPDLIPRMGMAGRRIAENRYDVYKINAQVLASMRL